MTKSRLYALVLCTALTACAAPRDRGAQSSDALCAQGKSFLAEGKVAEARNAYRSATYRNDENTRAWNGLGVADEMSGRMVEAEKSYREALRLAPGDMTALNNLSHLYIATGDSEDALRLLEPYEDDESAPVSLKENLALARSAQEGKPAPVSSDAYADLGAYPTSDIAQEHIAQAQEILGSDGDGITYAVTPDVAVTGGTPIFDARATGKPPQQICATLMAKALPCTTHDK